MSELSSDGLICPYCQHLFSIMEDLPWVEGNTQHTCSNCSKTFEVNTITLFSWETLKDDE